MKKLAASIIVLVLLIFVFKSSIIAYTTVPPVSTGTNIPSVTEVVGGNVAWGYSTIANRVAVSESGYIYGASSTSSSNYIVYNPDFSLRVASTPWPGGAIINFISPVKGDKIFMSSSTGVITLYDAPSGNLLFNISLPSAASVQGVALLGNGNLVIAYSTGYRIYTQSGTAVGSFVNLGGVARVTSVNNGNVLLVTNAGGTFPKFMELNSDGTVARSLTPTGLASGSPTSLTTLSTGGIALIIGTSSVYACDSTDLSGPSCYNYSTPNIGGRLTELSAGIIAIPGTSAKFFVIDTVNRNYVTPAAGISLSVTGFGTTNLIPSGNGKFYMLHSGGYIGIQFGGIYTPSVGINGGTLAQSVSPIAFSEVVISNSNSMTSTASSTLTTSDNRGSGAGWSVTLSITSFISNIIPDPSGGNGNLTVEIPPSACMLNVGSTSLLSGQEIHGIYGPKGNESTITLANSPQVIVNASPGYGMGIYTNTLTFTLTLPKLTQVKTLTGTGSKYTIGETVGTIASTYTSTFTFTTSTGV